MSIVPSVGSTLDGPSGGSVSDVVGLILDKGLVIDAYVRVSLVGMEILTVDARVVVASVDTYLRFAEAANRLDLEATRKPGLTDLVQGVTAGNGLGDALRGVTGGRPEAPGALGRGEDPSQMGGSPGERGTEGDDRGEHELVRLDRRRETENGR